MVTQAKQRREDKRAARGRRCGGRRGVQRPAPLTVAQLPANQDELLRIRRRPRPGSPTAALVNELHDAGFSPELVDLVAARPAPDDLTAELVDAGAGDALLALLRPARDAV